MRTWWSYEGQLFARALYAPFWKTRWALVIAPPLLALGGVAASIPDDPLAKLGVLAAVVCAGYLLLLLVLLIRQPFAHARELSSEAAQCLMELQGLKSEIRLPAIQRDRLHRLKHLAGFVEVALTSGRYDRELEVKDALGEITDLCGYLAEYPVRNVGLSFAVCADKRTFQVYGPRRTSPKSVAQAQAKLRDALAAVQAGCDAVLMGEVTASEAPQSPKP